MESFNFEKDSIQVHIKKDRVSGFYFYIPEYNGFVASGFPLIEKTRLEFNNQTSSRMHFSSVYSNSHREFDSQCYNHIKSGGKSYNLYIKMKQVQNENRSAVADSCDCIIKRQGYSCSLQDDRSLNRGNEGNPCTFKEARERTFSSLFPTILNAQTNTDSIEILDQDFIQCNENIEKTLRNAFVTLEEKRGAQNYEFSVPHVLLFYVSEAILPLHQLLLKLW